LLDGQPICTPDRQQDLRAQGSYPSGHTSIGWAWALVRAEASPTRALLARGRAFGESRLVCNVHWESDVIEGRFIGAATVARLHDEPEFLAGLAAARRGSATASSTLRRWPRRLRSRRGAGRKPRPAELEPAVGRS
jgi:acid phosphatase (class A)